MKIGLLPKWLFISTTLRIIILMTKHTKLLSHIHKEIDNRDLIYLQFGMGMIRYIGIRKIQSKCIYITLAISFILEAIFFIIGYKHGCYSLKRVIMEVTLACFSLGWMMFLYPYYLVDESKSVGDVMKNKDE
ncbi:hypothetical protein TCON_1195 [Astathelohania contejeani]|uniref:Uncharacterized protein n=1 Tax=Astathelohania contejeani TaxID=164912 RepID=A0ABQ7HZH7_9MICR|nr:hypothetical protein TCON_1195 [Thelohania contejeani]